MSVDVRLVSRGFAIFAGRYLSSPEAKNLARLLDSKQELVAHLLLKTEAVMNQGALVSAIREIADDTYSNTSNLSFRADVRLSEQTRRAADVKQALTNLIQADRNRSKVAERVDDALYEFSQVSPGEAENRNLRYLVR